MCLQSITEPSISSERRVPTPTHGSVSPLERDQFSIPHNFIKYLGGQILRGCIPAPMEAQSRAQLCGTSTSELNCAVAQILFTSMASDLLATFNLASGQGLPSARTQLLRPNLRRERERENYRVKVTRQALWLSEGFESGSP